MAGKSRKNKRKLRIIWPLTLVLVLLINANILIIVNNQNLNKEYQKLTKTYEDNSKNLTNDSLKIQEIDEKIKTLNNIEEDTKNLEGEYFKAIKDLEDNILNHKSNSKIAYLTFDDGPYYNTYKVLDILDKYNVKATFFTTSINGENCFDNPKEKCLSLYKEYEKPGILLLDEYDVPLQNAYVEGFYDEAVKFFKTFYGVTFKDNPYLEKTVITGVSRVAKESIFSRSK